MGSSRRWRNLGIAAGAVTSLLVAGRLMLEWASVYASDRFHNDFTFYYAAARIGLTSGWAHIYDLQLQQGQLNAMGSGITVADFARYISPPPLAWAAAPLTALPYPVAYWTWIGLLLLALVLTWRLAAPGLGPVKLVHLAAALGWLPIIYGLQLGQPGLFVALAVAASYALVRAGRPAWAGVALGVLVLKPQLALLVPIALLVAGRWRAFAGSLLALGLLGVASAINLGPTGVGTLEARLSYLATLSSTRTLTIAPYIGNLAVTRALQVAVAVFALVVVYRLRRRSPELVFVAALIGGLLATPYLHLDDLVVLGLAGWLYLRTQRPAWTSALVLAIVIAVEGMPLWGPLPMIAGEFVSLVLLSVSTLNADDRDPEHHQAEGRHRPVRAPVDSGALPS